MSRSINLDAAVDVVEKWFENIGLNGDICLDGLRQLPSAQPEPKWIPVSERLPEEGQTILVTTTNGWHVVAILRTFFKDMHKDIVAWMPLPEPYREEGGS